MMRQRTGSRGKSSEKIVKGIRRATRMGVLSPWEVQEHGSRWSNQGCEDSSAFSL